MFAADYNKKGVAGAYAVSITVHVLILILVLSYTNKQKKMLEDYMLTEITMIQEIPDAQMPQRPVEIEKPKNMFERFKQIIPVKQEAKIELAKDRKSVV